MKPFNLEEYLEDPSKKVITRDGRQARIICIDRLMKDFPICALINENGEEYYRSCTKDGKYYIGANSNYDLFFAPEKKEGWVNIYREPHVNITHTENYIFKTEKEAKENACDKTYIATVKIEWEE